MQVHGRLLEVLQSHQDPSTLAPSSVCQHTGALGGGSLEPRECRRTARLRHGHDNHTADDLGLGLGPEVRGQVQ